MTKRKEGRDAPGGDSPDETVSLRDAARVWLRIGLLSFGGPAGQVALMHRELVERRRWIDEGRFLHALNYCMLLPGPEAQQLATYIGWLMHRTAGGLVAGWLFVLPGFAMMLALNLLYATMGTVPVVAAMLFGVKAAVLAVVVEAVQRIATRALRNRLMVGVAALAFVAIFVFEVPFPVIVAAAAAFGWLGARTAPSWFSAPAAVRAIGEGTTVVDRLAQAGQLDHTHPSAARATRVLVVGLLAWALPIAILWAALGRASVFVDEALFFSKAAVVTFGGAYAVLAYVAQRAVDTFGWLAPGEMVDGLGLAETTPGPLILVLQFVGFLGAMRAPGPWPPLVAGIVGASVTVWVTFVPCFLWIFLGAPFVERLRGHAGLHAALSTITAAVVGVVLNLSLWFALHVVFRDVHERHWGPARVLAPEWASVDLGALVLAAGAMVAVLRFHVGIPKTLAVCATLGVVWRWIA